MTKDLKLDWKTVECDFHGYSEMAAESEGLSLIAWKTGGPPQGFGFKLLAGRDAMAWGHTTSMLDAMIAAEGRAEALLAMPIKDRAKIALAHIQDGVDRWSLNRLLEDYERLERELEAALAATCAKEPP